MKNGENNMMSVTVADYTTGFGEGYMPRAGIVFTTQNGWTKEKMLTFYEDHFKGKSIHPNLTFNSLSEDPYSVCAYRGSDGKKCNAGIFIPGALYKAEWEGYSVNKFWNEISCVMPLDIYGMAAFQKVHDNANEDKIKGESIYFINTFVQDAAV